MKVFFSVSIEKEFLIQEFFDNYGSSLSNQDKSKMKQEFIEVVQIFKEAGLIEDTGRSLLNGSFFPIPIKELTPQNISEGFVIYKKLKV